MGTAIRYLLNHQIALRRFLDDGRVPIDNGIVERLHVRTASLERTSCLRGVTPAPSGPPSRTPCSAAASSPM
jgi:transposase IS66 family protein